MTTLLNGPEPAAQALITRLGTLDDYIALANAAVTDGITVDAPVQVLPYVPPLDQLDQFPVIGVGDGPGRWEDDTGFSATGVWQLTAVWFLQDADQLALTTRARRALNVLVSCVMDGRVWTDDRDVMWSVRLLATRPGAALADRPGRNEPPTAYLTWVGVAVEVKTDEP